MRDNQNRIRLCTVGFDAVDRHAQTQYNMRYGCERMKKLHAKKKIGNFQNRFGLEKQI